MKRMLCAAVLTTLVGAGPAVLAQETKAPAAAPKSHTETTTKASSPDGSAKVKTETVVGTVKAYTAGKKLTVTGPKKKTYSFDLDQETSMTGDVAIGDRVKVTYTKVDGKKKVSIVAAYTGKA